MSSASPAEIFRQKFKEDLASGKIPADQDSKKEYSLAKIGRKLIVDTKETDMPLRSGAPDFEKIRKMLKENGGKKYLSIHTHPYGEEIRNLEMGNLPSAEDFAMLLPDDETRGMAMYQQNPRTGEIEGLYIIRKTKKTLKSGIGHTELMGRYKDNIEKLTDEEQSNIIGEYPNIKNIGNRIYQYGQKAFGLFSQAPQRQEALDEIIKDMNLQMKYVPAPGYEYVPGESFMRKGEHRGKNGLGKAAGILTILIGSALALNTFSKNLTGFAINNSDITNNQITTGIVGLIIILIGIAILFKRRKKVKSKGD